MLPGMFMRVMLQPWQEFVGQRGEGCRVPETESIWGELHGLEYSESKGQVVQAKAETWTGATF